MLKQDWQVSAVSGNPEPVRHPDQVGQRFSQHLMHHPPTVDFYCSFTGPEFRCNLLIEQPGNDQTHDFTLSDAQATITRLQFC
jgi:hypothetical protein